MGRPTDAKHRKHVKAPASASVEKKPEVPKRKRRRKRSKVDGEIRRLRRQHTKHQIPREAFKRLLAEIVQTHSLTMRVSAKAVDALHEAAEMELTGAFTTANDLATNVAGQAGILPKDFQAAVRMAHPLLDATKSK